ncbi:hypothetical protein G6L37_00490 [Agrobacterium rubi]|nr:hypothetical protein [Agrobacterium rubi]NTF23867.1 hypothetical protein [Agrobacterium rubi]
MTKTTIRRFKPTATEQLQQSLLSVASGNSDLEALTQLLELDELTTVIHPEIEIDCSKFEGVTRKYEFGRILIEQVGQSAAQRLLADDDVWPWLSLLFCRMLMPSRGDTIYVGDLSRHMIVTLGGRSNKARHRHLVRGAVNAVHRFGSDAEGLMDEVTSHTTFEEQIMSRTEKQRLAASREFVRLVNILYWDKKKKRHRKGAAKGKQGSMLRLIDIVHQLEANYAVTALTAEEFIPLLPQREFKQYLP